jgi:hypothetical protein
LVQTGGTQQSGAVGGDSDGDNDGSRASGADRTKGPAAFMDSVFQALSQAGVTGSSSSTSSGDSSSGSNSSSSQNPVQALGAFMHDLFAALQSQGGSDGTANGVSGAHGGHHHHHGGGMAQMESNLQGLIQQVSSSSANSTSDSSASATTTATTSTSATTALEQSYQNLLSSLGATGSSSSLGGFLQALSQNLQGIGSSGNVVSTKA